MYGTGYGLEPYTSCKWLVLIRYRASNAEAHAVMRRHKHMKVALGALTLVACLMAAQAGAQQSGNSPPTAQEIWRHLPPLPGLKSKTSPAPAPSEAAGSEADTAFTQPEGTSGSGLETAMPDTTSSEPSVYAAPGMQNTRPPDQTDEAIPQEAAARSEPSQLRLAVYVPEQSATDQRDQMYVPRQ